MLRREYGTGLKQVEGTTMHEHAMPLGMPMQVL
jgi:hypothetical protein